ncbi:HicB family protein [Lentilactobacillus raoultii]|uniref:HicB family protein n=1 Tax=Lentilactobacillus raoultii TaxID=1987503 RepID=A0ABW3PI34_9LACO|nr:HicB family protein [Lentilactobacillus raoultii]
MVVYGRDEKEAVYSANEVLGLVLANRRNLPKASIIKDVSLPKKGDYVVMITADLEAAKKEIKVATVKKNTTIPADLNEEAMERGINFSKVLADALRKKLRE